MANEINNDGYSLAFDLRNTTLGNAQEKDFIIVNLERVPAFKELGLTAIQPCVYSMKTLDDFYAKFRDHLQLKHILIHMGCLDELIDPNDPLKTRPVELISDKEAKLVILDRLCNPVEYLSSVDLRATNSNGPWAPNIRASKNDSPKGWSK